MDKRYRLIWLGDDYSDPPHGGFIGDGVWGVVDTFDTDRKLGIETFAKQELAIKYMDDLNRNHEAIDDLNKFIEEHQDDDGISDRDRRADYLYESGYSDRVGLDSFAYDSRGNDTGLRESDFI